MSTKYEQVRQLRVRYAEIVGDYVRAQGSAYSMNADEPNKEKRDRDLADIAAQLKALDAPL